MPPLLGYWNIRGFCEAIRRVLAYAGEEYNEKTYVEEYAPPHDCKEWNEDKKKLQEEEPFANLPYYRDGDVFLVQSMAILRYLGRKYNLCGSNEKEYQRIDVLLSEADDLRMCTLRICYKDMFHGVLSEYIPWLKLELQKINKVLGEKSWFLGDKLTIVDFAFYEFLDWNRKILEIDPGKDVWDEVPNIKAFFDRFEALPQLQSYCSEEETKKMFIWSKKGNLGGECPKPV